MSLYLDIKKEYKGFSLHIHISDNSSRIGLLGASGCGKSLTLKCIAGIITPDQGRIVLNDRVFFDSESGINISPRHRNVGLLFQNYALFPNMTVKQNIEIGIKNKRERKKVLDNMTAMFRLEHLLHRHPGILSGGEQQRVALARMLASEPAVLMFDEPFSALDAYLKEQLQMELMEVLRGYSGDTLMVSHDQDELYRFCETIAVLKQGKIIETGQRDKIFRQPVKLTTAIMTGCRNISRAVRISEDEFHAEEWNLTLRTEKVRERNIKFVGIRAQDLVPCQSNAMENAFPVKLAGFAEYSQDVDFRFQIAADRDDGKDTTAAGKDNNAKDYLYWELSKSRWKQEFQESIPTYFYIPREQILLLNDNDGE